MNFKKYLHFLLLSLCLTFMFSAIAEAKINIPESLKEWVPWVLHDQEEQLCSSSYTGKQKFCVWPEALQIDINGNGGTFSQNWKMEKSGWIILPGNEKYWPQEVLLNNETALVINNNGYPSVFVESSGEYEVKGRFLWQSLPESLHIPPGTGIIAPFSINGKKQAANVASNKLWISKKTTIEQQERNVVQTNVYRRITDSIPMLITTHIAVIVSGKPREIVIDWQLPENQIPIELHCSVPVKIADKKIHMQARPGSYIIVYKSRITNPVESLKFSKSEQGPESEYWSFESRNNLRIVKISGVSAVDPSQTSIPQNWHSLPAYLVKKGDTMLFETIKRGDSEPAPNNFRLSRKFWLDASGEGITVQDSLSGVVHENPRLEMQNPGKLGRVTINGRDQLITTIEKGGKDGVEVRQGKINAKAVSRIEGTSTFPAGGWGQTIENLSAELILQPGWKLFHAQGIDSTRSWISRWTLLDCFIVLIIVIACFKILGVLPSVVAFIALVLSYHDYGAPVFIWLGILACIAVIKTAPNLKHIKAVKIVKLLLFVGLVIVVIPYSVEQLRQGFYPQLERSNASHMNNYRKPQEQHDMVAEGEHVAASVTRYATKNAKMAGTPVEKKRKVLQQLDTQAKVQSGPGLPSRMWNVVPLKWNGPVDADLSLKLYLISPLVNMLLIFLKVAAIYLLALFMIRQSDNKDGIFNLSDTVPGEKVIATAILVLTMFSFAPAGVCSEYPPSELLDTLQARLLEPSECFPRCADFNSMDISLAGNNISVKITANSLEETAVSLPTGKGIIWQTISLNKEKSPVLSKDNSIWLLLSKGHHEITMKGIAVKADFQFTLPLKPHVVFFKGDDGWSIAGIDVNGVPAGQLQFVKQEKQDAQKFGESTLPPSIKIERVLQLGIEWYVKSTVTRLSPLGTSVYLKVPLLDGESVTDEAYKVRGKNIEINMGPNIQKMQWTSVLEKTQELSLIAPDTTKWNEIWKLNASPIWHVESTGIPVIQYYSKGETWQPEWHPWANEKVTLNIAKPPGVEGDTKTIESSKLKIVPGLRSTSMDLSIVVRSTRGDQQTIILPSNVVLQSVKINNRQQPIKNDSSVVIPIAPGSQNIEIKMTSSGGISTFFKVPEINLGMDSVNSEIEIKTGARWVWFVKGPQMGPAILFYSELLIILLVAIALGYSQLTPLSAFKWVILGLGLSQSGLIPCLIIVSWFIALQFRKEKGSTLSGGMFNGLQITLVLITILSCGAIIYAVQHGLLGHPDMQIAGNGSNSFYLRWYQDHISAILPQPIVVSIPIMAYRILMLIWALWLAFNLLAWVKWGWECLTAEKNWDESGFKRKKTKN